MAAAFVVLTAGSAAAAVTPYSWIRGGEANSPYVDSSGNNRTFNMAFSTGNTGTLDYALVPFPVGGPLGGAAGPTSTVSTLFGPNGRVNSAMWQDPWTFPAVNYALEVWILPLGTGGMGTNVNSQFASTGNNVGGTGIAFRTKYIPAEYDPENPEVILIPERIELRLVTFEPGNSQETQPVTVPKTKWTHVAAVNDAGSLQLYINGVSTGDPLSFAKASVGPAYVGGGNDTANPFHGYMDEIRYSTFEAGKFLSSDLLTRAPGPQILTQPAATSVWEGGAAPFEVNIAYDETAKFQWKLGGTAIPEATTPDLILPAVTAADNGASYSADITSDGVTVTSAAAVLTVAPPKTADTEAYRSEVQAEASLLAFFPVDGDSGATLSNVKNPAQNGTAAGTVTYDGRTDRSLGRKALRFTGTGQVSLAPNAAYEFSDGTGTVEAIVYLKPDAHVGQATLFSIGEGGAVYYQLRASLDGGSLSCANDQLTQPVSWAVPVSLKNRFAHVAFVFSANAGGGEIPYSVTAYVDGESLGTKPLASFGAVPGLMANIGSAGLDGDGAPLSPWRGTIDELAIYGDSLSPTAMAVHNTRFKFGTAVTVPEITGQPTGTTNVLAGGAPSFRVTNTGTAPLFYQWKLNGADITGNPTATTATLVLDKSTVAMSGQYTVTVTNPQGSDTSDPFTVNFSPPPDNYSSYVLADGPSAYWRMNDTSTVLKDYAGGLDGTYSSTVNRGVAGVPDITPADTAATFPASGTPLSNAEVPYTPILNPSGPFTIECWVRPGAAGALGTSVLASQNRDTGRAGYVFYQGFDGDYWGMHVGFEDGVIRLGAGGPPPVVGRWDHIAAIWDGSNTFQFYVNGAIVNTMTGGPFRANLAQKLEFGTRFNGQIPWNGTLDEVAFYNKALTLDQLRKHWSITWIPSAITQQPAAAVSASETGSFTITAAATGFPNTYQWLRNGVPLEAYTNPDGSAHYPQGVNSPTLTVSQSSLEDAGSYQLVVTNPLGEKTSSVTVVTVTADTTPPAVAYVTADGSMRRVRVGFNRWVTPETAGVTANYTVSGGLTPSAVVMTNIPSVVDLVFPTPLTPGTVYTLSVSGVRDQRGSHNLIGPNSTPFSALTVRQGVLAAYFYAGVTGNNVSDLVNTTELFPDGVGHAAPLESFSTKALTGGDLRNNPEYAALGLGDNYGTHIYGWITPTVSGDYTFFLDSDDGSELWISSDNNPANADLIAMVTDCCQGFKEPSDNVPETSAPISLVAGQSYYIEAFQKEGGGGDYVQVAWRMAGDTTAAASLPAIPGAYLSSYNVIPLVGLNLPVVANGNVTITWGGPGTLQQSDDLLNWENVPGSPVSPYVAPAAGRRFYRLAP